MWRSPTHVFEVGTYYLCFRSGNSQLSQIFQLSFMKLKKEDKQELGAIMCLANTNSSSSSTTKKKDENHHFAEIEKNENTSSNDDIIPPILMIHDDGTPTEIYYKNASFGNIRNGDGWKGSKEDNRVRSIAVLLKY